MPLGCLVVLLWLFDLAWWRARQRSGDWCRLERSGWFYGWLSCSRFIQPKLLMNYFLWTVFHSFIKYCFYHVLHCCYYAVSKDSFKCTFKWWHILSSTPPSLSSTHFPFVPDTVRYLSVHPDHQLVFHVCWRGQRFSSVKFPLMLHFI